MKNSILIIIFLCIYSNIEAQISYSALLIPDSLTENANAVIRKSETELTITDLDNIAISVEFVITILNKGADDLANILIYYDSFSEVSDIKGTIYDKNGIEIKKIKKSEIDDYSTYNDFSLIDDSRIKYYTPAVATYPYTIEYKYEIHYSGNMFYPEWEIFPDYKVSVEYSSFSILSDIENYRFLEKNFNEKYSVTKNTESDYVYWKVTNLKAIINEPYSPGYIEFVPFMYFAPNKFIMDNYIGNMQTWEEFGNWINKLNFERNILSEVTKLKIHELVANVKDTTEMVKILYEYMQSKTRYVSIQLGIGGWQPFEASFVDEKGYGDCKALSNYMYSILYAAGIKSHYTLVKAGAKASDIITDFPKSQFNHAILCVPLQNDTIWLECTDQKIPFGYIGTFTDNRNVLIITENGGKIVKTKEYQQEQNTKNTKALVTIDSLGTAKADIEIIYSGLKYDDANHFLYITTDEQKKYLYSSIDIPDFQILEYDISEKKEIIPSITQELSIISKNYASSSGKRIFIPLNLLSKITEAPVTVENRTTDVIIKRPYIISDTIEYTIPQNFEFEYITESKTINSDFGEYNIEIENVENKITYIRTLKINEGTYPPEKYADLIDFMKQIIKSDNEKIVIKRV
jgi:transglutaminase-like putative cysteine protease